ncbi:hypothetical protein M1K46_18595 [Fictibacillus sp. WQ 8-8]|uniref:hypothetical protein n=1 Tax=Fictibacillus sp. WQ 8-8 TaxID=2938788 RepID=UPI00210CED5A|nr:hypothetical protein [Fictibacillus sp. WQ 8-8]MCQ6267646.1 hypothetical protein [Fictibacillus sp. WQ 8-8]
MKNVIVFIVTSAVIVLVNVVFSFVINVHFIDLAFIVGLLSAVVFKFFPSSGGLTSNMIRLQAQAQTGMKVEEEKKAYTPGIPFYTAIAYTLISLIATIVYYKEYFLK